ncbi:MAG: TadE/TadG family type IV pilus assembly protein [Pseudomonadota bacterium]
MIRLAATTARQLAGNRRGATIVEFALVMPVLGLLLLGTFDIAHSLYMRAVLEGIVQKAARDATLESGTESAQQAALDLKVETQVHELARNADVDTERTAYRDYRDVQAQEEPYTDNNHDGTCNHEEPYEDDNENGRWDTGASVGQGSAKDATLYTVTVTYPRAFPLHRLIPALDDTTTIRATTVLRNQPYHDRGDAPVLQCP